MSTTSHAPAAYRLAGQTICFDRPLPELKPFQTDGSGKPGLPIPAGLPGRPFTPDLQFLGSPAVQAKGWLMERVLTVSVRQDESGYYVEIPEAGTFWTARDGRAIAQLSQPTDPETWLLTEAMLGPPLVLALAVHGTWCLHASAVEFDGRLIAFLGASGAGKSTLAAYLANQAGLRAASDDILPVLLEKHKLYALPHFPQLKIPTGQQPGAGLPEKLPLAGIYLLDEQPGISIEPLSPANAALALASHTVAARLFDRELLSRHFTFCSQAAAVAGAIPLHRLAYPRRRAALPQVWHALREDRNHFGLF